MAFVTIYHPDIDGVQGEVPEELVEHWAELGWTTTPPHVAPEIVVVERDGETATVPAEELDAWTADGWKPEKSPRTRTKAAKAADQEV